MVHIVDKLTGRCFLVDTGASIFPHHLPWPVLNRPQRQADPLLGRAAERAVVPWPLVWVDIPAGRRPVCHYWGRFFAQPPAVGLPRGEPPCGLGVAAVICDGPIAAACATCGSQRDSKVSLSLTTPVVLKQSFFVTEQFWNMSITRRLFYEIYLSVQAPFQCAGVAESNVM